MGTEKSRVTKNSKKRCVAINNTGKRCKKLAVNGSDRCRTPNHAPDQLTLTSESIPASRLETDKELNAQITANAVKWTPAESQDVAFPGKSVAYSLNALRSSQLSVPTYQGRYPGFRTPPTIRKLNNGDRLKLGVMFSYVEGSEPTIFARESMIAKLFAHLQYAIDMAENALNFEPPGDQWRRFFGDTAKTFMTVTRVFKRIAALRSTDRTLTIVFEGNPQEDEKKDYAWHLGGVIYLNTSKDTFLSLYSQDEKWLAEGPDLADWTEKSPNALAVTLLHELTHVRGIGGYRRPNGEIDPQQDIKSPEEGRVTGWRAALSIAVHSPRLAEANAESYACFALECWYERIKREKK